MKEKRIINLTVFNRKFPVRVNKDNEEEEENLRDAVKLVNKKVQQYRNYFSDKDNFAILAMVTIQLANELMKIDETSSSALSTHELLEIGDRLDEIIND